ncbi:AAA family ATPase [Ceratobasidium sp. AG-Ba]|nr:AAA family ATPase [Ceratobasidium sp. AG-Ba]
MSDPDNDSGTRPPRLRLTVRVPNRDMAVLGDGERRITRSGSTRRASGSDFGPPDSASPPATRRTRSTRTPEAKPVLAPDGDGDDDDDDEPRFHSKVTRSGRHVKIASYREPSSDQSDDPHPLRTSGRRRAHAPNDFIAEDDDDMEEEHAEEDYGRRRLRPRPPPPPKRRPPRPPQPSVRDEIRPPRPRQTKNSARAALHDEDGDYSDDGHGDTHDDDDMELDLDAEGELEEDDDDGEEEEGDSKPRGYSLRARRQVNYTIPQLLDVADDVRSQGIKSKGKAAARRPPPRKTNFPRWGANGIELSRSLGMPLPAGMDSDSDNPPPSPHKLFASAAAASGGGGGLFAGGSGMVASDLAASGAPSNLGKVNPDSALADTDPLGTKQNITFDQVGGLDDHINSLKEMIQLPLLYPEIFQQFNITPPRGVLFHGPPGTGKTLVARALAATSKSDGKSISFFMRKGADCLSKWVGEAERQLRLLFDEAKACQPSIIFFDEIDGLAPVRSSKQDQIHASIVSTLLALMDGMDGRGQVVVIGATNRPDAVDPALRRPGRFDREFYFGLPSLSARRRILEINTSGWAGWSGEAGQDHLQKLAEVTKGYGGADLRALCTEAALNAVQRRYPQIYKASERLLVDPKTIEVQPRDFMVSVKNLIPSSARSASSHASPLPPQLVPLLKTAVDTTTGALEKSLPSFKKRNLLEEAEWEYEGEEDGGWEREMISQAMEALRVHRPRILLHGPAGMGHTYVGGAVLHFLEGYHVQTMDLATLMGDSTRTVEAGIVQLFVEAKRHKPAVIYIPSLVGWCAAVPETARLTMKSMLDSIPSTDPILLLAIVEGDVTSLPQDVRGWFGFARDNYIQLTSPSLEQRQGFFAELISTIRKPPNMFPDAVRRKRRVLEDLPIAPPLPPRQPSKAEIAAQLEADMRTMEQVTFRLSPVLSELKKKFKRFSKSVEEEYGVNPKTGMPVNWEQAIMITNAIAGATEEPDATLEQVPPVAVHQEAPAEPDHTSPHEIVVQHGEGDNTNITNGVNGTEHTADQQPTQVSPAPPPGPALIPPQPIKFHDVTLEKMHHKLYYTGYLTGDEFLGDIAKIVQNAETDYQQDPDRTYKARAMLNNARLMLQSWEPQFRAECERMAVRETERRAERKRARIAEKEAKAKEKEKEANGDSRKTGSSSEEPPVHSYGTRRATRHNGLAPDAADDPVDIERRLKRQRSEVARASAEPPSAGATVDESMLDPDPDRAAKRARTTPKPDGSPVNIESEMQIPGAPNDALPDAETTTLQAFPTTGDPGTESNAMDLSAEGEPDPAPRVEPLHDVSIATPEFQLDESNLRSLEDQLVHSTDLLTVEQLEQLRALCLNVVWQHRGDWQRDTMLGQLAAVVTDYLQQVQHGR